MARRPISTIGYGNRDINTFVALLMRDGVKCVLDCRSTPKAYDTRFDGDTLNEYLPHYGITYAWMGAFLGGRPTAKKFLTPEGRIDYLAMRGSKRFLTGIGGLLETYLSLKSISILCSELRPEDCHRAKLIAEFLSLIGYTVQHVGAKGEILSHEEVMERIRLGGHPLCSEKIYTGH